jgi:hypothetical protein
MSRLTAAPHDAPRVRSRRIRALAVPTAALVALALGLPATGHASTGKFAGPGKSDQHKPAGAGSGRRVR